MQVSLLKKGLGNKHFSLVICSQGKNVNYIDVMFPPLFISLPEILLWKKLKSSGLQITMWSIRFENIETIIKGEVQYPRLKFVLIIETIRLLIRHTGYIKEKHEEIPKQRGSIGHISGKWWSVPCHRKNIGYAREKPRCVPSHREIIGCAGHNFL